MKYRYFLIASILVVCSFFYAGMNNLENLFPLEQVYVASKIETENGDLKIEKPQKYLVLRSDTKVDLEMEKNLISVFDFSKVKYDILSLATEKEWDFSQYVGAIIVGEDYNGLRRNTFEGLEEFVRGGNPLFILKRSIHSPFNHMAGIDAINDFSTTDGVKLTKKIYPGYENIPMEKNYLLGSSLNVQLSPEANILAVSHEGTPILWEMPYGNGRILYGNTTLFNSKNMRGLMKQFIAFGSQESFFPILNSKVVHIDDFPAPIPAIENKIIYRDYGMSTKEFYKNIWWKDMVALSKRQQIKYSVFMIGDYNANTKSKDIGKLPRTALNDLNKLSRDAYVEGAEIGIHGFNHQSLSLEGEIDHEKFGYNPWDSIEDMKKGLKELNDGAEKVLGKNLRMYSYVPPSNHISKSGKQALVESYPYLRSLNGVFHGDKSKGLLLQEVGRDPDIPNLYSIPRFSSGFFNESGVLWNIYDAVAAYGYVSHFIHPDDLIDFERGRNYSWDDLRDNFEKIFSQINRDFPHLNSDIQNELTNRYARIENIEPEYERNENNLNINIKNFSEPFYAEIRLRDSKIDGMEGGTYKILEKNDQYSLYLVKVEKNKLIAKLGALR